MGKTEFVYKMAGIIEELPQLSRDVIIFRYACGCSNKDISNLFEIPEEQVAKEALYGVIMILVKFKKRENCLFRDKLLYPTAKLALENWAKQLPNEVDCPKHQFSETFERKMRAIYIWMRN